MSERDKLIARLRMVDTDDRRLPFHCMRHDAADQMERDRAEIARLREECTRWRQVWDNVQLDVPELRDDNKPLAVAASYELTKRERDEARAALAEAQRDAERYRLMRRNPTVDGESLVVVEVLEFNEDGPTDVYYAHAGDPLDAAIDAAIAKEQKP